MLKAWVSMTNNAAKDAKLLLSTQQFLCPLW